MTRSAMRLSAQSPAEPRLAPGRAAAEALLRDYRAVREVTERLCAGLSPEDQQAQSMVDASPAKWHRAHTTWFFETFLLRESLPGYAADPDFAVLFNSYYNAIGDQYPRAERGLITRPGAAEVGAWRQRVDAAMEALLGQHPPQAVLERVLLGLNHEQQHQELLLTDLKHLFSRHPSQPALEVSGLAYEPTVTSPARPVFLDFPGGEVEIGAGFDRFAFDMEGPRHPVLLQPYALADQLVTNAQYQAFIDDGGYRRPELWLSAGWEFITSERIEAPLYWARRGADWEHFTLHGRAPVDPAAPVAHVSYYEADAFARWAGARLPTEHEWEAACTSTGASPEPGGFGPPTALHPTPHNASATTGVTGRLHGCFGAVWQWTRSSYEAYPRYAPAAGAIGEYNGKFMSGQYVLRGSSCATPLGHARPTYRNFFPPAARWQFSGLRLAQDRT